MHHAQLKQSGLKATRPRLKVLELLNSPDTCCMSAKAMYQALAADGEVLPLGTVYRVLADLEEAGLVVGHHFAGEPREYGLAECATADHMVCETTGAVIKFEDPELTRLQARIAAAHGYDLVPNSLSFRVRPAGQ